MTEKKKDWSWSILVVGYLSADNSIFSTQSDIFLLSIFKIIVLLFNFDPVNFLLASSVHQVVVLSFLLHAVKMPLESLANIIKVWIYLDSVKTHLSFSGQFPIENQLHLVWLQLFPLLWDLVMNLPGRWERINWPVKLDLKPVGNHWPVKFRYETCSKPWGSVPG